jgi:uncharacterized protein (TIGR02145 family)
MKQKNKIQLLLVAAFAGLSVMCYAQGKVCAGTAYNIVNLQDPSDPSAYEWWEDGKPISGATAAAYTVPSGKAVGKYTYVRRSKKDGCDWASSNAYTVEVLTCGAIADGASNGAKGTFEDPRDKKVYKTVKMPDGKVWMAENLNYQSGMTFNQEPGLANGKPFVSTEDGIPAIGSFWCPAVNAATVSADKNTCNVYGALYTWETAMSPDGKLVNNQPWNETAVLSRYHNDTTTPAAAQSDPKVQGICPTGWHLPSDFEWATLLVAIDPNGTYTAQVGPGWSGSDGVAGSGSEGAGVKLKSASTYIGGDPGNGAWVDSGERGNDAHGFNALAPGYRYSTGIYFAVRGSAAYFCTSTPYDARYAWYRELRYQLTQASRTKQYRVHAASVRCLMD